MPTTLPSQASLDHLKKQAKSLLKNCRLGQAEALNRLTTHHPSHRNQSDANDSKVKLQETQLVIAREYGFPSWPKLVAAIIASEGSANDASRILLITNGSQAIQRLNDAGIPGHKEEWLEVLHDGPVPITESPEELNLLRARHIATLGWSGERAAFNRFQKRDACLQNAEQRDSLQLWFEHDLYDQLQLVQILNALASQPDWIGKAQLAQFDKFLGELPPEELATGLALLKPVTADQITAARNFWFAFRQPSPESLANLLPQDLHPLPFLRPALKRICEEHPSLENGLGRTEQQILEAVASGAETPGPIFRASQSKEQAVFMGDLSFFHIVDRLSRGKSPLLKISDARHLLENAQILKAETFKDRRISLSNTGQAALDRQYDRLADLPEPYWIGGAKIDGPQALRWDARNSRFTPSPRA